MGNDHIHHIISYSSIPFGVRIRETKLVIHLILHKDKKLKHDSRRLLRKKNTICFTLMRNFSTAFWILLIL